MENKEKLVLETMKQIENYRYPSKVIMKACSDLGITSDQLVDQPIDDLEAIPEVVKLRQDYYGSRRRANIRRVAEYIISSNAEVQRSKKPESSPLKSVQISKNKELEKQEKVQKNLKLLKKIEEKRVKKIKDRLDKEVSITREISEEKKQKMIARDEKIKQIREDQRKLQKEIENRELKLKGYIDKPSTVSLPLKALSPPTRPLKIDE